MNPEDLAAGRFREIAKAREQIDKVEAALAKSRERHEELRRQLITAEVRDRERLGAALVASKPEPPSEAAQVKEELARQEERTTALVAAYEAARSEIPKLVTANRDSWRRQAMRDLGREKQRYGVVINELQEAREALNNAAILVSWLDSGALEEAATDALGGRSGVDASGRPVLAFSRTIEELRLDCEHLANYPVTRGEPHPEPRLERAWGAVQGVGASLKGGQ